ncbi:glycosyltransferase family 1 protein [Paraflavisolibacter sp. H34]|uniref:glycosyltransferase family 4 protein n=1 Tax=Huijunlia imazamoxiresistens TaxID=3127457 RepID=UPI00301B3962
MSTSPHRVLFDCERMKYPFTGLYYYCQHLGKSLLQEARPGLDLCFYLPPSAGPAFGPQACYVPQRSLHKFLLPRKPHFQLWHSTHQASDYYPWRRKMKVLLTVHDLNWLYDRSKTDAKKQRYLSGLKARIDRADHVVAISQFTLNDLRRHIDLGDKPCSVIHNGSNIEEITSLQPPQLQPSAPFFFTIGTIVAKKNFHVLPALLLQNDLQLVIAGITQSEDYKNKIIHEAKRLGVEERVLFTGSISENDKQWYLKNCTAFAFPSISEGFGLPVVEAMHFGKPLLLANATSLPEIGGRHAHYFDHFEPEHIHAVAQKALSEHTETHAAAIRQWSAQFKWPAAARAYLDVYSSLLQEGV